MQFILTNGEENHILYTVKKIFYLDCQQSMEEKKIKIITTYKKISDFVFHYLIFFGVVALAFSIFLQTISQSATVNVFQNNSALVLQKAKLIAGFNKFLKQDIQDNTIKIYILQGDLQVEQ